MAGWEEVVSAINQLGVQMGKQAPKTAAERVTETQAAKIRAEKAHEFAVAGENEREIAESLLNLQEKRVEAQRAFFKEQRELNLISEEQLIHEEATLDRIAEKKKKERDEELERLDEIKKKHKEIIESGKKRATDLGKMLGLQASFEETAVGSAIKHGKQLLTNIEYRKEYLKQLGKTFSLQNIIASIGAKIVEQTIKMAIAYDQAQASFNKATGAAGEYNNVINNLSKGSLALGVGIVEGSKALQDLYEGMATFSTLNKNTAEDLARTAATLEQVGWEGRNTAQIMNDLNKGLGMTAEAAMQMQADLAEWNIGVSAKQLSEDFLKSMPIMMKWGETVGLQVFKKLEKQSKSTGIAMQDLLGIAGQFNTFESAAEMAGRLNAVLGGNLVNSVELVTATEAERIEISRNAVFQSGLEWKAMNHLEKQMFANILTQGDMTKAAKLLTHQTAKQIEEERELAEMAAKSQAIMDKLNKAMMQLAVALGPLIDKVSAAITEFHDWADANQEVIAGWYENIEAIIKVVGYFLVFKMVVLPLVGLFMGLAGVLTPMSGGIMLLGRAVGRAGIAMTKGALGLLAFGAAVTLVGLGIGLAAYGLAQIALAFSKLEGDQIWGATKAIAAFSLALMGIFFAVSNPLGVVGVGVVLALTLSFAAMGLGIAAAAKELSNFGSIMNNISVAKADAFKNIVDDFKGLVEAVERIPATKMQNTAKLAEALKEATKVQANIAVTPPRQAVVAQPPAGGGLTPGTCVILKLRERTLAKGVIDALTKEVSLEK